MIEIIHKHISTWLWGQHSCDEEEFIFSSYVLFLEPLWRIHSCNRPVGDTHSQQEEGDYWEEQRGHDVTDGSAITKDPQRQDIQINTVQDQLEKVYFDIYKVKASVAPEQC